MPDRDREDEAPRVVGLVGRWEPRLSRRLGWLPGVLLLAFASAQPSRAIRVGMGLLGADLALLWACEWVESRNGTKRMATRIALFLLMFIGPLVYLAGGAAWLLGWD